MSSLRTEEDHIAAEQGHSSVGHEAPTDQSLKVAYLLPSLRMCGWRRYAQGFIRAIGHCVEPVLFVAAEDGSAARKLFPQFEQAILPAIQSASLRVSQLSDVSASFRAIQRVSRQDISLVHALEAYPTGLVGYWLARRLNTPLILTAHGTYGVFAHKRLLNRMAYRYLLRRADALCPVSSGTAERIRRYFAGAIKDLYIQPILNGNDYYQSVPRQEAMHRKPAEQPTILSVGAIKPRKGIHIGLQAFARLKQKIPSARYWIVGGTDKGEYYRELCQLVQTLQLKNVEFLGSISEERLRQCYREAWVFLLPAQQIGRHFEGFGLVNLEAGAFGLPTVGTRTGGVPDAIRHGETGLICEPNDVGGIADALTSLITNSELARRMGIANRLWAESLTWDRCAAAHFEVYQEVIRA